MKKISTLLLMLLIAAANSLQSQEPPPAPPAEPPVPPTPSVQTDTWVQKADFGGVARYGSVGISIENKGYIGLGISDAGVYQKDIFEYDPVNNRWTQKADFPGGARTGMTAFSIGNLGFFGTGANTPGDYNWLWYNDIWAFNPSENTWTRKNNFGGQPRYNAVAFTIGDKAYLGTGAYRQDRIHSAVYLNDFWEYDPTNDSWTRKKDVPEQGRHAAIGLSINNKGYIGTGYYYYDTRLKDFWEYDPQTNTWSRKADFAGIQRTSAAAFTIGNKGYVGSSACNCYVGGVYYGYLNDFWEYNPSNDSWKQKTTFPGSIRTGAVSFSIGQKGYLGLGSNNIGSLNELWEYTPNDITLTCPGDKTVSTSINSCDAVVIGIDPVISPANATPRIVYSISYEGQSVAKGNGSASGLTFKRGKSTVTYALEDYKGQTCNFIVNVLDDIAPVTTCPPPQTLCYSTSNNYSIPALSATDNCGIQSIGYTITGATNRTGNGNDASGNLNIGSSIITWTVTDASGNSNYCTTNVIVDNPILVTIPDVYAVNPGGNANTIYIGYGPTSLTLTTNASGGTVAGNYTYLWSTGATTATINVNPAVAGVYNYSVTITDDYGCTATTQKTIKVVDVRCGNKNEKVTVCQVPPGNATNKKVICVSANAVAVHLKNGSYLGECNTNLVTSRNTTPTIVEVDNSLNEKDIQLYPNPNKGLFTLNVNNTNGSQIDIRIIDQNGKTIANRRLQAVKGVQTLQIDLGHIAKGIYTVQAVSTNGVVTTKMIVQ